MFIPASTVSIEKTGALLYQVMKLVFFHISRYTNGDIVVIKQYPDFLKMPPLQDFYFHYSTLTPTGFSLYPQHNEKMCFQISRKTQNLTHDYQL